MYVKDSKDLLPSRWQMVVISPELYYEEWRETLGEEAHIYVWSDNDGVNGTFLKRLHTRIMIPKDKTIAINDGIRGETSLGYGRK